MVGMTTVELDGITDSITLDMLRMIKLRLFVFGGSGIIRAVDRNMRG